MEETVDTLVFEPVVECMNGGNSLQVCKTKYRGIEVFERTYFPWSPFKDMSVCYMVDLVFPIGTMNCLTDKYYTDEGFGVPEVNTLEEALQIIDNFKYQQTCEHSIK